MKISATFLLFLVLFSCKKGENAKLHGPDSSTYYTQTDHLFYVSGVKTNDLVWQFNGEEFKHLSDVNLRVETEGGYGLIVRDKYSRKIYINEILYYKDIAKCFGEYLDVESQNSNLQDYYTCEVKGNNGIAEFKFYAEDKNEYLTFQAKIEKEGYHESKVVVSRNYQTTPGNFYLYTYSEPCQVYLTRYAEKTDNNVKIELYNNGSPLYSAWLTVL